MKYVVHLFPLCPRPRFNSITQSPKNFISNLLLQNTKATYRHAHLQKNLCSFFVRFSLLGLCRDLVMTFWDGENIKLNDMERHNNFQRLKQKSKREKR